jgi:flagellar protein FlaG
MSTVTSATINSPPNARGASPVQTRADGRPVIEAANVSESSNKKQPGTSVAQSKPSAEEVKLASEDLQRRVATLAPELNFSIDEASGRSIIKFTDRATNEVIRQFPTEEALQLTKAMDQFQRGLLLNRKA